MTRFSFIMHFIKLPAFFLKASLLVFVGVLIQIGTSPIAVAAPSDQSARPAGPLHGAARSIRHKLEFPLPSLDPDHFRVIIVGDSQLSGPNTTGVRTQMHSWDANITGDLVTVGNSSAGYDVTTGVGGSDDVQYQSVDILDGWPNGSTRDFFAVSGHQWLCTGDVDYNGGRIAKFGLNFSQSNTEAPWNEPWAVGEHLIARIAIRTSLSSVPAIQVRPYRGSTVSGAMGNEYALDQEDGIQIIEQLIPAWIDPTAETVGVGLYFPPDVVEQPGMRLQVLGVSFHRANFRWEEEPGTFLGFQGRGSINVWDHIALFSQQSRVALIEMIKPDVVMTMLGHNIENLGIVLYEPGLTSLKSTWDNAFVSAGRETPIHIFVSPWGVGTGLEQPYMRQANVINRQVANRSLKSRSVSLFDQYNGVSPEVFDPVRYNMDFWHVHPGDGPTARSIAFDLYGLIFRNR